MATQVFTTWAAFRDYLLDEMAKGVPLVGQVSVTGKSITYNPQSFKFWLDYAEQKAAQEAGTLTLRTYAKQGGRGT